VREFALRIRGALGLRGRIAGVILLASVVTLTVAAVALLGPLEHSLRKGEQTTLKRELHGEGRLFRAVPLCTVSKREAEDLKVEESLLSKRVGGGSVTVLGGADADAEGHGARRLRPAPGQSHLDPDDSFRDAATAFRTGKKVFSFARIGGNEYARGAIPFTQDCPSPTGQTDYVIAVRRSIAEIPDVVNVVNRAFLDAALAGLALTLVLGIPLSWRLVRRLRRLREAALAVAHDQPQATPVTVDTARDEVGDLARALTTMQQRLFTQEQARRSFVATASHELRTPLASLDGMLELLDEDLQDSDPDLGDARALLDRARAQSRRLGRLAADLLDLSRIDAQVRLRSEPVELGEISRAVLAEFELGTQERGIHPSLEGHERDPVWALGDPGSVARILRILLDNAVRVSPPGGRIVVSLGVDRGVAVSVSDEGPGVHADERESIFERFSRGRDTAGQAGFGLGLAIGRELARRMGGDLVLEPANGGGAQFTLRLPAALAHETGAVPVA
jgi:signal transduction histidine kinase